VTRVAIEPGIVTIPEGSDETPQLLGSRCEDCGAVFHPPRRVCLTCYGQVLRDAALGGVGTLYACTQVHMKLRPGQRDTRNYWVGQVDLDAGPRVQGILAPDIGAPMIGMRLNIALETLRVDGDGNEIVVHHFRRDEDFK
jgi:uncharacterized OB-fold protein